MRALITIFFICVALVAHAEDGTGLLHVYPDELDSEQSPRRPLVFRFGEHERNYRAEAIHPPPRCEGMSEEGMRKCFIMREAQRIAGRVPLAIYQYKGSSEIWREFVIVAYNENEQRYHSIMLEMPLASHAGLRMRVKTPGFVVVREKGESLNQMTYAVKKGGHDLLVYAAKYLLVPKEATGKGLSVAKLFAEEWVYLSTPEHLNTAEFCATGADYALEHLGEVFNSLRKRGVASRSISGRLVADTFPLIDTLAVIGIEQSDVFRLFGPKLEHFFDGKHDLREFCRVYSTYMINGLIAFRFLCSKAPACGPLQFTDIRRRKKDGSWARGTYTTVRQRYPEADIDPKFTRGTGTFFNSAKAALLLFDLERQNNGNVELLSQLRVSDPALERMALMAQYNGGGGQGNMFASVYERHNREFKRKLSFANVPWSWEPFAKPAMRMKPVAGEFFPETVGYMRKYQILSEMLGRVYGAPNSIEGMKLILAGR